MVGVERPLAKEKKKLRGKSFPSVTSSARKLIYFYISHPVLLIMGYAVVQLVEALRYKPEGRGFDYRLSHWNFLVN
jgi:hypothetical protein